MKTQQLQLLVSAAKESKTRSPEELLEYVIKLYGDEFIKANDKIAELQRANDELFRIKQRVVIANRELLGKFLQFSEEKRREVAHLRASEHEQNLGRDSHDRTA
jgi:hypothetical protein